MSETKTKYVGGVRFFTPSENAPKSLCANGVITPKELGEAFKQEGVENAKSEYQGNVQYKVQLWKNEDGTYNLTFNTFKPTRKESDDKGADDLPF